MAAYEGYCHICLRNFSSKSEETWRSAAGDFVGWVRRGPLGDFLERQNTFYGVCYGCMRARHRKLGGRKGQAQGGNARRAGRPGGSNGRLVLMSPLAIGFSQRRVRPKFQDGGDVWGAFEEVMDEPYRHRSNDGNGEDDTLLLPPFAPIEVVRWRRVVGRGSGSGAETTDDETQEEEIEEGWFTLDNRRLLCLQGAAMKLWPKYTCCVVRILGTDAMNLETALGREFQQKFTTLSAGERLEVTSKLGGAVTVWDWRAKAEEAGAAKDANTKARVQKDADATGETLLPAASYGNRYTQHPSYRPSDPEERESMKNWFFLIGILVLYITLRVFFPGSKRLIMTAAVVGGGTWITLSLYDQFFGEADDE